MLGKKLQDAKNELETLRAKDAEFEKREQDLEGAINEAQSDEEKKVVEDSINAFDEEKKEHEDAKRELETKIKGIETELEEVENAQATQVVDDVRENNKEHQERGKVEMNVRDYRKMSMQERDAFCNREDVKGFLDTVKDAMTQKRAITNTGLLIPRVMVEMLRPVVEENSKLIKRVNLKYVAGESRQNIMGNIPEGVWTEMCANLNELSLGFNNVELDGYKVGGYFAVCNATLEDADIDLAGEIIMALGQAIGLALDKAIVYGTGVKMPLGIVSRLAQSSQPATYPATARPWVDLRSHLITGTADLTGVALFKEILTKTGVTATKYKRNAKVFLMNEATHLKLKAEALSINVAGAIVTGIDNIMPVVGGEIVELEFIPDNNVVFGYGELYLLAERAGTKIEQSEHVRFLQDQTVFKGTARYDGTPVIPEAFAVYGIDGTVPTTSVEFPEDTANFQ